MSSQTRFLSRYIGLYELIAALTMCAHKQATVETVTALVHDGPLLFLVGLITVVVGLALVLVHNVWSGGAPTVIVTLIGWLALIKGSLILLLPPDTAVDFFLGQLRYRQLFYGYAAIVLVLGIYLTAAGFRRASP